MEDDPDASAAIQGFAVDTAWWLEEVLTRVHVLEAFMEERVRWITEGRLDSVPPRVLARATFQNLRPRPPD